MQVFTNVMQCRMITVINGSKDRWSQFNSRGVVVTVKGKSFLMQNISY